MITMNAVAFDRIAFDLLAFHISPFSLTFIDIWLGWLFTRMVGPVVKEMELTARSHSASLEVLLWSQRERRQAIWFQQDSS